MTGKRMEAILNVLSVDYFPNDERGHLFVLNDLPNGNDYHLNSNFEI